MSSTYMKRQHPLRILYVLPYVASYITVHTWWNTPEKSKRTYDIKCPRNHDSFSDRVLLFHAWTNFVLLTKCIRASCKVRPHTEKTSFWIVNVFTIILRYNAKRQNISVTSDEELHYCNTYTKLRVTAVIFTRTARGPSHRWTSDSSAYEICPLLLPLRISFS